MDSALREAIPSARDLSAAVVDEAGRPYALAPAGADDIKLASRAPRPAAAGWQPFTYQLDDGRSVGSLDIYLYRSADLASAEELWHRYPPEVVRRETAPNFVDSDEDEVERRLPQWRFTVPGSSAANQTGLCIGGWNARGVDGCFGVAYWVQLCNWVLEAVLSFPGTDGVDLIESLGNIEAVIRGALPCE